MSSYLYRIRVQSAVLQKRTYDVNVDWRFLLDCAHVCEVLCY